MDEDSRPKLSRIFKPYPLCCPCCGSLKVKPEYNTSGWLTPPLYICETVGTVAVFLEVRMRNSKHN